MAMTSEEIKEFAEEVVTEVLELVDQTEVKNNSFFRRVPRYEIGYLISTIRQLSTTVLNLATTAAGAERLIQLKDEELDALQRENLKLLLDKNHLEAKLAKNTESITENNEKE